MSSDSNVMIVVDEQRFLPARLGPNEAANIKYRVAAAEPLLYLRKRSLENEGGSDPEI
jgi:hypothetical protein